MQGLLVLWYKGASKLMVLMRMAVKCRDKIIIKPLPAKGIMK